MRLTSLHLENFKRFTDLRIEGIPASAKLVLLIGSNGCGKSSVFDGLNQLAGKGHSSDDYLLKDKEATWKISATDEAGDSHSRERVNENSFRGAGVGKAKGQQFYGRSSIRIVPALARKRGTEDAIAKDTDAPRQFTQPDERIQADAVAFTNRIDQALRAPVFDGKDADTVAIFNQHIKPMNDALARVFGDAGGQGIKLKGYDNSDRENPIQLHFGKGGSTINFDLLSHGEKQVVTLLLNLLVRRDRLEGAVYYIDEMDLHLNTRLQRDLLAEIVEHWIPEDGQLWTASHALGFIEYAEGSDEAVVIDFDDLDFDQPQVLRPAEGPNLEVYEIAVPKESIANLLSGRTLVHCEGKDHALYNLALSDSDYVFLPARNSDEVWAKLRADSNALGLRDRDLLTEVDIGELRALQPNFRVLPFYSIESLLYHPDNIGELDSDGFSKENYLESIKTLKNLSPLREAKHARNLYKALRDLNPPRHNVEVDEIYTAYESDDFDRFYPLLSVKKRPEYLQQFQLGKTNLARTHWFSETLRRALG